MTDFELGPAPILAGEVAGEGMPVVLCHGLTATRHDVVHGSKLLERSGFRVITYDVRGHGASGSAPGDGYGYDQLVDDLTRVIDAQVGDGHFLLGGHSMGAHTAVGWALRHQGLTAPRLAGLVLIGPVFDGDGSSRRPERYWDGLADALAREGTEGFVDFIGREEGVAPAYRDSVLRSTRRRLAAHRTPEAVVAAIRETPRSWPFTTLADLAVIDVPVLVVASNDDADPTHPFRSAAEYAEALPRGRLATEAKGESPLAWQPSKLSRRIVEFAASLPS